MIGAVDPLTPGRLAVVGQNTRCLTPSFNIFSSSDEVFEDEVFEDLHFVLHIKSHICKMLVVFSSLFQEMIEV